MPLAEPSKLGHRGSWRHQKAPGRTSPSFALSGSPLEHTTDLATRRTLEVWRGDPSAVLSGRRLAVTEAPVPGFARIAGHVSPVEVHPFPWLVVPTDRPVQSFSAWRRRT